MIVFNPTAVLLPNPVTISASTPLPVSGTVTVSSVASPISVNGPVSVNGTVGISSISNPVSISGTVPVSGSVSVSNTVPVSGTVSVGNAISISGTVPVSGNVTSTISGPVSVTQPLSIVPPLTQIAEMGSTSAGVTWVSGTIVGLSNLASTTVLFDLTTDWNRYPLVVVTIRPVGPSSGLNNIMLSSSNTTIIDPDKRLGYAFSSTIGNILASLTTASGSSEISVRPKGRYLFIQATNADLLLSQGAAKMYVAVYAE